MMWILGADGLVGQALQKIFQEKGVEFIASGRKDADITMLQDLEKRAEQIRPTYIFNCAAYTLVDDAEENSALADLINIDGVRNIALVAKQNKSHLIHISTDYVFSEGQMHPFKEDDVPCPVNQYGFSKLQGERVLASLMPKACIVRTSWVYGPSGKNFISSLMKLFKTQEIVEACFDQLGKPTYCMDLARALYELKDASGVFHFAGSLQGSRYEIACALFSYMQQEGIEMKCQKVVSVSSDKFITKARRPKYSVLDTLKFEQKMGRKPLSYVDTFKELFS